ncbi:MAG: OadG family protein [Clostridiales bacterium]|jgi:sodium pump decarboxylase gamma subunit|nr:OadG family protein [Clostridiales bacterium]
MQLETIELGVSSTIIGMGVVFSVLIILTFTTWLLTTLVDGNIERKKAKESAASAPVPVQEATPPPVQAAAGISAKTVAAIMGAVSLACGKPLQQLRFTAIRRGNTTANAWSDSGTADIINNRQVYL